MYYNIYQISQKPINSEDWITESDFYMSAFLGTIADKIENVDFEERCKQVHNLGKWLENQNIGRIDDSVLVLFPDMLNMPYYHDRYQRFKTAAEALSEVSLEQYLENLDGVRNKISDVENQLIQQMDHYVCWDSDDPIPLDEFLRTAATKKAYYVGGVCKFKY